MPVRVRVRNFQSIEDAEVVVDRFTAVTGANNSGKTATMRAIQGVFSNPGGDAYVRHGKEKLSVELDFGDGQTVVWEKGPKVKPTYKVKGKTLHPGRGVPDEVAELGVQPITVGSMQVWPQVAPQFTGQVFLLDLPGSNVAEAVADVERVGKLTQALRLAESDKRGAAAELKVRKKDAERLQDDVRAYAGLDAVGDAVAAVEKLLAEACQAARELGVAEDAQRRLRDAGASILRYEGVREVPVPPPETAQKAARARSAIRDAEALRARLVPARAKVEALAGVRGVRVPEVAQEARASRDELAALRALASRTTTAMAAVARARKAADAAGGVTLGTEKSEAAAKARKALEFCVDVRRRLRAARIEAERCRSTLESTRANLDATETEVREVLGGLGTCPVCKTPVAGNHPC